MPYILPVRRKIHRQHFPASCINIKIQFIHSVLPQAILIASLGNHISSAGIETTRINVKGQGQLVPVNLHIIRRIDLYPLVKFIQINSLSRQTGHQLRPAHNMSRSSIR